MELNEIKDSATKNFSKERWIWIVLVSGISILWGAYNLNVEQQLSNYREDVRIERFEIKEKDSLAEKKNKEIISLYREVSGLEDKLKDDKKPKK